MLAGLSCCRCDAGDGHVIDKGRTRGSWAWFATGACARSGDPDGIRKEPGGPDPSEPPGESGKWGRSSLTDRGEFPRPKLVLNTNSYGPHRGPVPSRASLPRSRHRVGLFGAP